MWVYAWEESNIVRESRIFTKNNTLKTIPILPRQKEIMEPWTLFKNKEGLKVLWLSQPFFEISSKSLWICIREQKFITNEEN